MEQWHSYNINQIIFLNEWKWKYFLSKVVRCSQSCNKGEACRLKCISEKTKVLKLRNRMPHKKLESKQQSQIKECKKENKYQTEIKGNNEEQKGKTKSWGFFWRILIQWIRNSILHHYLYSGGNYLHFVFLLDPFWR